jgi:site-specific DNA recombinase
MHTIQAAIDARVSSERQAETHPVASQVAARRERVTADGLPWPEALQCIDEAYRGATLVRPALERLRDLAAAGAVDRLYVHSPDRLARKYAYQVLRVDEFQRAGVEVVCLNRELGRSPEDDLLLQGQGMVAEYERAKISDRHRRGKRHAARAGAVHVLSGAPYGYRDIPKYAGGGQACYEMVPDEARVVGQVFEWVGHDRLTIGEGCRRLTRAGERTRTGTTIWDRSVVWGMVKNPAYLGTAACGKTPQRPWRPRLRAQRGRPVQPRRAVSTGDGPPEDWITIPVPSLVDPALFTAVQEPWRDNRRHARQSRRGALDLLQGLVPCQHGGYAYDGKRLSPSARTGRPRAYADYRCLGTDAYRFGGERVWQNPQVRTDLLDLAVWQEVCALLAQPERLAEEYRRRLQADGPTKRTTRTTLDAQLGKLRQGLARLIDSDAEALIEKHAFEPRITRLRQRIAPGEAQRQQMAEQEALDTDLCLIIGRLEDCATGVQDGLAEADWSRKREMTRALVKRVEVDHDQVKVVFRIEPRPSDPSPEKKSLQDCRRRQLAAVGQCVGAPVRAQRHCAFDGTVSWWEPTSSLWRRERPSPSVVVSFQRTARVVRGTADPQEANAWDRIGRVSRLLAKMRRDNGEHTGSDGLTVWKTRPRQRYMAVKQTRGRWSGGQAHAPGSPGLQGPHQRERARQSTPPCQRAFAVTRDPACASLHDRVTGLGGEQGRPVQSGHRSRGSHAPSGRRSHRPQGDGPQVTSFKRGCVQRD